VKTISLKKVSAVAVASLGFGLLSVVPANAAQAATGFTALNIKAATANTNVTGTSVQVFVGGTLAAAATDWVTTTAATQFYRAAVTTYPTNGFVVPTGEAASPSGLEFASALSAAVITNTIAGNKITSTKSNAAAFSAVAAETVTATGTAGLASYVFTPTVAGSYSITVWNDVSDDGVIDPSEARATTTVAITAAADLSPTGSIAWMTGTAAGQAAAASSATNALPRTGSAATGTYIAQIAIDLQLTNATDDDRAHTVSATVSGLGYVAVNTTANTDPGVTTRVATDSTAQSERYVHIETDGLAGTGSVTVSVTHAVTGVTSVLGTWSYTAYGTVAKIEVSTKNFTIGKAGDTTGYGSTTRTVAGNDLPALDNATTVPAFIIKMTDSGGRPASRGANPTFTSSNAAAITGATCDLDDGALPTTASSSVNGVGFYNCSFTTAANAVAGSKATLTAAVVDPADATKEITTTIDLTVGGSVSTETIAFDKTAYAPGEAMKITRTAKDSSGNPVADGTAAPAITFSKSVGGTAPAASFYVGGTLSSTSSAGVASVFAPAIGGAFTMQATSGATGSPVITASSSVTDANAGLLTQIDALNAKIVALNALIAKIMKKLGVK
jgi:hypothetical protein